VFTRNVHNTSRKHTHGRCRPELFTKHGANITTGNVGKNCSQNIAQTYQRERSTRNTHTTWRNKCPQRMFTRNVYKTWRKKHPQEMVARFTTLCVILCHSCHRAEKAPSPCAGGGGGRGAPQTHTSAI
jgi:hypothetical protein